MNKTGICKRVDEIGGGMLRINTRAAVIAVWSFCFFAVAEDAPELKEALAPATPAATLTPASTVPAAQPRDIPFDYTIEDGLYATLTAMTSFKVPETKEEKMLKIAVLGFKKDMDV